ncbi:MAG: alpha/beta hydrolase-fold protein [Pseudomonadota bacterium]
MTSRPNLPADGLMTSAVPLARSAADDFLSGEGVSPDAVEGFFAACQFPIIEPGRATFAWRGEADWVALVRWIHAGVDRNPFARVPGTDLWLLQLPVEDGGRFENKIAIGRDGNEAWTLAPFNPARAGDPFGENSVCSTHGYVRPEWTEPRGAPQGRIVDIAVPSDTFGEVRGERLYVPADHRPGTPLPIVVIHDGDDYVTYADLAVSLDNLIAAGDIPPVFAALVQTRDRMGEYTGGRQHARYLAQELLPFLEGEYSLMEEAKGRVLLGASLGAVASLSTAFRYPGVFGGLVLKSGSFILDERKLRSRQHPVFHRVAQLVKALRRAPSLPPTRAFVSTGELEGLADENRALATFLHDHGVDVLFKSAWDGHHWHNWRDQLRDGLMWVLRPGDERN